MTIKAAFLAYMFWLKRKQFSPKTIANYTYYLRDFVSRFNSAHVNKITLDIIDSQITYNLYKNFTPRVYRDSCICLRAFMKWLVNEELVNLKLHRIIIPRLKGTKKMEYLTEEELNKLLLYFKNQPRSKANLRDFAVYLCLYTTGCRISELLSINRDLINNRQMQIIGKGDKLRTIFFSDMALEAIKAYLLVRKDKEEALFLNHSNFRAETRLTRYTVQKRLRKVLSILNINKKVTPHTFRHTFARLMMKQGANLRTIQMLLGHESLETTQKYLHLSDNELKANYDKFHYLPELLN